MSRTYTLAPKLQLGSDKSCQSVSKPEPEHKT